MKIKYEVAATTLALGILGVAVLSTHVDQPVLAATNVGDNYSQTETQDQKKPDPPAKEAPLTRA